MGVKAGREHMRNLALDHNVAYYDTVRSPNGTYTTEFRFKTLPEDYQW